MVLNGIPISEDECIGDSLATINSAFQTLSVNLAGAGGGTVTNVTGTAPISVATGTTTPAISIAAATTSAAGSMSSTDKTRLDDASGVNGLVKCNGSGDFSAAVAGTDYVSSVSLSAAPTSAKAWVNFNGTGTIGTNQTIRSNYNVSSITKNGTGDYTVNFATPMANANYSILLTGDYQGTTTTNGGTLTFLSRNSRPSTSSFRFESWGGSGGTNDSLQLNVAVFGN